MSFSAFFRKEFFRKCGFGKQTFNVFPNCPVLLTFLYKPNIDFISDEYCKGIEGKNGIQK